MKRKCTSILALLLCVLLLAGCGAGGGATADQSAAYVAAGGTEMEVASADAGLLSDAEGSQSAVVPEGRKWIVTVYLSAETEDLDAFTDQLETSIGDLEGYVEDQNVYNGSAYASRRYRNASFTIRIPVEAADQFTQAVSGIANVVSQQTSRQDITLTYVSTESRVTALETEEARLLELLAQAQTMADLLEIEARLTEVRSELEDVASQLRLYDNQVDYATIYLDVSEVQEYTAVEEPTVWERISGGFRDSLAGVGEGAVNLVVWILANSPYLLLAALAVGLLVFAGRRLRRRRSSKKSRTGDQPPAEGQ